MRKHTLLAVVLATAALPLAVAGPASAGQWSSSDPVGDVERLADDPDVHHLWDPAPTDARTDVRRLVVRHTATNVEATFRVRDLGSRPSTAEVVVRTPQGRFSAFGVHTRQRDFVLVERVDAADETDSSRVRCGDAGVTFDPDRDTVRLVVPRSCFGDPAWVRVHGSLMSVTSFVDDPTAMWLDDAAARGITNGAPRFGPRIPSA